MNSTNDTVKRTKKLCSQSDNSTYNKQPTVMVYAINIILDGELDEAVEWSES